MIGFGLYYRTNPWKVVLLMWNYRFFGVKSHFSPFFSRFFTFLLPFNKEIIINSWNNFWRSLFWWQFHRFLTTWRLVVFDYLVVLKDWSAGCKFCALLFTPKPRTPFIMVACQVTNHNNYLVTHLSVTRFKARSPHSGFSFKWFGHDFSIGKKVLL